jgi:rSAM/selenodomain-associated transferase 1
MSENSRCIIVFTRHPELGVGKRRLAKTLGDEKTFQVYRVLLGRTQQALRDIDAAKHIWYAADFPKKDAWSEITSDRFKQDGEDLGARMEYAFAKAYKQHSYVIIIGTDLYDINQNLIEDAFSVLDQNDAVIGPAEDGGYYLLGFKNAVPEGVFADKKWSGPDVFKDTLNDLRDFRVHHLPKLNDVDTVDDAVQHPELKEIIC